MRDESSFWMLHSGDKVERVQVSGRLAANNVGMLGGWPARDWASRRCWCSTRWSRAIKQSGLVRVLPEWSLTPLPLFALLPSRMLPAKTKAFLDFIQPV